MGLRARLSIFTGFFLTLMVFFLIASGIKERERVFSERVGKETSPYFLPAQKLMMVSAHLEKNLIRIEESRLANDANRFRYSDRPALKDRFVFPDDFFTRAQQMQKEAASEADQMNFDELAATARIAAAGKKSVYFPTQAAYLQNRILINAKFSELYLSSLAGLDRRFFRIQALDRAGNLRNLGQFADTMFLSDTYNDSDINKFDASEKIPDDALFSLARSSVSGGGKNFTTLTSLITRNEEIGFRARMILKALKERRLGRILEIDNSFSPKLKQLASEIMNREDALTTENPPRFPAYDPDWKKLADEYQAVLTKRDTAVVQALNRTGKMRGEEKELMLDSLKNLRGSVLDRELIVHFSFSYYTHGYSGDAEFKRLFENRYASLRSWILSGAYETAYPYPAPGELIMRNRRDALARMSEIDTASLADLAKTGLEEDCAGYVRILVDDARYFHKDRMKERDRLIDTAAAFGLRIFFLAAFFSTFLVRRIQNIIRSARRVGEGDLGVEFEKGGSDEVGVLASSLNLMVRGLREREEMRGEMSAAEEIQKRLLPDKMPSNMEDTLSFGTFYKAMMGVGGDYFDLVETGKDTMAFCIADVSSHGAGPAIIMTMLRAYLRAALQKTTDVIRIAKELNERMFQETPDNMFITMFLGVYDRKTGQIKAVNAGHNKSLVYRYRGGAIEEFDTTTLPLGAVGAGLFDTAVSSQTITIGPGDLFFQFTDGVNEAMNGEDVEFGMERIRSLITEFGRKKPVVLLEQIAKEVESFTGKKIFGAGPSEQKDDIAMIAFRRVR